jgi:hypothetical protein
MSEQPPDSNVPLGDKPPFGSVGTSPDGREYVEGSAIEIADDVDELDHPNTTGAEAVYTEALWRQPESETPISVKLFGRLPTALGEKYWARFPDGTEGWLSAEEIDLVPDADDEKGNNADQPQTVQEGDGNQEPEGNEGPRLDNEEKETNPHKFKPSEIVKYIVDGKLEPDWRVVGYPEKLTPDIYVRIIKNGEERWPKEDALWRMQSTEVDKNTAAQEELVKKYSGEPVKVLLDDGKVIEGRFAGIGTQDDSVYLDYEEGGSDKRMKVNSKQFEAWQTLKTEEELDAEEATRATHEAEYEEDEEDEDWALAPEDDLRVTPEDFKEPKKRSKRIFEKLNKMKKSAAFPARIMLGDKVVDYPGNIRKASQKAYAKAGAGTYLALAKWFDAEGASEQERLKKKYRRRIYTVIGIGAIVAADYFWHEPYHSRLLKPPEDPSNLLPPFLR